MARPGPPTLAEVAEAAGLFEKSQDAWRIELFPKMDTCRAFPKDTTQFSSAVIPAPPLHVEALIPNGIVVGGAKIFDVATLTRMLNDTATQLAGLSGFNAASINAAFGNLQGVSRDTSYFNAQLTTAATPQIVQQNTTGLNSPDTTTTTTPQGTTNTSFQCPSGSLPGFTSSGTFLGCTAVNATGTQVQPGGSSQAQVIDPPGSVVTNTGNTATTQNQTTTTTPSYIGVAPAALPSTALAAPTNIGVGAADVLAEQVQINAQLTNYRMLLNGALSDQYLLRNAKAIGLRQQTTVGFSISLDPPPQYKHAVAEIRIVIVPPVGQEKVSVARLLPEEKPTMSPVLLATKTLSAAVPLWRQSRLASAPANPKTGCIWSRIPTPSPCSLKIRSKPSGAPSHRKPSISARK